MIDVRDGLPKGLNAVDIQSDGERTGALLKYGDPFHQQSVYDAFSAWGVVSEHLLNPLGGDRRPPKITTEYGPCYMLRFADGKWRYARFGGLNGPPWFHCEFEGYVAKSGPAAYIMMKLRYAEKNRDLLKHQLADSIKEVEELKQKLSECV